MMRSSLILASRSSMTNMFFRYISLVIVLHSYREKVRKLAKNVGHSSKKVLLSEHVKLQKALVKWQTSQFDLYLKLRDQITSINQLKPEDEKLLLPSLFNQ